MGNNPLDIIEKLKSPRHPKTKNKTKEERKLVSLMLFSGLNESH